MKTNMSNEEFMAEVNRRVGDWDAFRDRFYRLIRRNEDDPEMLARVLVRGMKTTLEDPEPSFCSDLAYFAQWEPDLSIVKIGKSRDPHKRCDKIGLMVIHAEYGGSRREAQLHAMFHAHRVKPQDLPPGLARDGQTEWFRREGALAEYLEKEAW